MGSSASSVTPPLSPQGRVWQAGVVAAHAQKDGRFLASSSSGSSLRLPSSYLHTVDTAGSPLDARCSQQTYRSTARHEDGEKERKEAILTLVNYVNVGSTDWPAIYNQIGEQEIAPGEVGHR
ncbi:hypothetical protein Btru_071296 [Bulinus truncatus]|nr:hypothetical protein Btru_071296 [Bulinus truncatus]